MISSAHNWKPTEEILVSLGFIIGPSNSYTRGYPYVCHIPNGIFYVCDGSRKDGNSQELEVYPKSLEELRTLISMMKP